MFLETEIDDCVLPEAADARRASVRAMDADQWVDAHASGTLRKNKRLVSRIGCLQHVRASDWIRERVPVPADLSRAEAANLLAEASMAILASDPDVVVRSIHQRLNCCGGGVVIDGLRNPRDFACLFEPLEDTLVVLRRDGIGACNSFEEGISAIEAHGSWVVGAWGGKRRSPYPAVITVNLPAGDG